MADEYQSDFVKSLIDVAPDQEAAEPAGGYKSDLVNNLLDPSNWHYRELQRARDAFAGQSEDTFRYFTRRSVPLSSAGIAWVERRKYEKAVERFNAGNPETSDIRAIADYEERKKHEGEKGFWSSVGSGVARIPAILGEAAIGGTLIGPGAGAVAEGGGSVGLAARGGATDRKSTRLNSSHIQKSRMPSSA